MFAFCSVQFPAMVYYLADQQAYYIDVLDVGNPSGVFGANTDSNILYWAACHDRGVSENDLYSDSLKDEAKRLGYAGRSSDQVGQYDFRSLEQVLSFLGVQNVNPVIVNNLEQKLLSIGNQQDATSSAAQAPDGTTAERRVALVFGESDYINSPRLANPTRDAAAVAKAFEKLGFTKVIFQENSNQAQMLRALSDFSALASSSDWAVIYFAGHGLEIAGENYLLPIDVNPSSAEQIPLQAVSLSQAIGAATAAKKLRLMIVDACRDNPFVGTVAGRSIGRGLARIEPVSGTLVAFAARAGQIAADGEQGGHSPFVAALLDQIFTPNLEVNLLFRRVHDRVLSLTSGQQEPFTYGALPGVEFYFAQAKVPTSSPAIK
jgi:hypothetical protein